MAALSTSDDHITRVRAMFDFNYTPVQNEATAISFKAGDEWCLISQTSVNWWLVRHVNDSKSFYVPASYVKIIETVPGSSESPGALTPKRVPNFEKWSQESDVLKELDSILDLEDSIVRGNASQNNEDDSDSDCEPCYANINTLREALSSHRHRGSDTSDYRSDSHESLDSSDTMGSIEAKLPTTSANKSAKPSRALIQPLYENHDTLKDSCYDDDPEENYANLAEIQKCIHRSPQSPKTSQAIQRSPGLVEPSNNSHFTGEHSHTSSQGEQRIMPVLPKIVEKQGHLNRAKTLENGKTRKPKWSVSYMVLCEDMLYFFKELKTVPNKLMSLKSLGKPETSLNLSSASLLTKPIVDKNKSEVLEVTAPNSAGTMTQYYLHHSDAAVFTHWQQSLQNNIDVLQSVAIDGPKFPLNTLVRREVFGTSLAALCERDRCVVPRFIQECLYAVESRGLQVDGIYRVGGNVASAQKLKMVVDHNEFYDLNTNEWDIHVVTSALKLFFRELPEPLFPFDKFDQFLLAFGKHERQARTNAISKLIDDMPKVNVDTMKMVFQHLNEVTQYHLENRMQAQNLAIVFGPTLMWSPNDNGNLVVSMVQQGQLMEYMITEFRALFSGR